MALLNKMSYFNSKTCWPIYALAEMYDHSILSIQFSKHIPKQTKYLVFTIQLVFNQCDLVFIQIYLYLVFGIHHTTGIQSVLFGILSSFKFLLAFDIQSAILVFGIQCWFKFIWYLGKLSTPKPRRLQYTKLVLPALTLRVSVLDKRSERCAILR